MAFSVEKLLVVKLGWDNRRVLIAGAEENKQARQQLDKLEGLTDDALNALSINQTSLQ